MASLVVAQKVERLRGGDGLFAFSARQRSPVLPATSSEAMDELQRAADPGRLCISLLMAGTCPPQRLPQRAARDMM